jgi:hypothetical protein
MNLFKSLLSKLKDDEQSARTDVSAGTPHADAGRNGGLSDVAKIIEAQSRQAIVFRQHFPPSFTRGLSYFGGAPTVGAGFSWPRWTDPQGEARPQTFIMQVACSEIPPSARLGVMPDDGVLYFFMEISERLLGSAYRVIYQSVQEAGPINDWIEAALPEDLPPALSRYLRRYAMEDEQLPRVLPRWAFTPTAIEIPAASYAEREADEPYIWPGISAEALMAAQGGAIIHHPYSIEDFTPAPEVFRKPFETFPHDWRAVQYLMGMLIKRLEDWKKYLNTAPVAKQLSEEEKRTQLSTVQAKAQHFYDRATAYPADEVVPSTQRDEIWAFLASVANLSRYGLAEAVTLSVEDSLMRSPKTASLIPAEAAERIRGRHALVVSYEGNEHVNTPERMLAPPTDVQGGPYEWAGSHLLLLELSSEITLGRDFGEGVFHFYIAPEDLKARRFDKVKLECEAY